MDTTEIVILVAAAVLVVLAVAVWAAARARRRAALRDRFGPEYDRMVESTGSRRDAERTLADRARQRDELDLRDLRPAEQTRYQQDWYAVQARFVEDPAVAVHEADSLVKLVMRDRGYPVEDFDTRADLVSADHPDVVENYRQAHGIWHRHREGQASTEDLRTAMVHYRSLFEELLGRPSTVEGRGRLELTDVERDRTVKR